MLNIRTRCLVALAAIAVAAICPNLSWAAATDAALPDRVQFNRDVRPILSDKCFTCHGPDKKARKSDLRLDTKEGIFTKVDDDYHIVLPANLDDSELYTRIISTDKKEQMPPRKFEKKLTSREVAILKKWIQQGASWEGHWAFIPPKKPAVPSLPIAKGNHIDAFIGVGVKQAGFSTASQADRRTLIRRLSFDLVGLPPTAAQVKAFINDKSPDAYEKLVDQLLTSKHYGERMAVYWLDLVRFADSIGYHSDNPREVWMYRDYVIKAFNENYRFDRFTREQLAGDMLPKTTNETKIASGYNKLLQTTREGGSQAKEYLAKYAADRVRNVSEVWMSATMACAECHDHKYDPFTTRDFYSMATFFADIKEKGVGQPEQTAIPNPAFESQLKELDAKIAAAQQAYTAASKTLAPKQAAWEQKILSELKNNKPVDIAWIDDQTIPQGTRDGVWKFIDKKQGPVFSGTQSRKQEGKGNFQHFIWKAKNTINLVKGNVLFVYVYLDTLNPPKQIMLQFNDGKSWEHRAWWGQDLIEYGGKGSNGVNHRKLGDLPETGKWVRLEVTPEQVGLKPGNKISGFAFTQYDGLAYWDKSGVVKTGASVPTNIAKIIQTTSAKRTAAQSSQLGKYFAANAPQLKTARAKVDAIKKQRADLGKKSPKTLITLTTKPRMMRILPRGNWLDDSGDIVSPNTPTFMVSLSVKDKTPTRRDLAEWLLRKDNPMVARTFVNRLWKQFYGYGIARTLEDMGAQGEWPTHPELLDWLAVEFVESGWDVKRMVKLMVMASTYKQSSVPSSALASADPYNRLYATQSRWRLDAEFVRDNALSISSLLVKTIGGPSVKPYQPAGYWQHLNFPRRSWKPDSGAALYRRGLYTHWQRSFLHPSLIAFDAPSREECTAQRPRSNTPQQALVLLNDPTYVEAARVFAQNIMTQGGKTDQDKLNWAMSNALQRKPSTQESQILLALHQRELAKYKAAPDAAKQLLSIGSAPAIANLKPDEAAAWTSIARTILNLHETVTRN
jgi:cytochrome c553